MRELSVEEIAELLAIEEGMDSQSLLLNHTPAQLRLLYRQRHIIVKPGEGEVLTRCDRKACPIKNGRIKKSSW